MLLLVLILRGRLLRLWLIVLGLLELVIQLVVLLLGEIKLKIMI